MRQDPHLLVSLSKGGTATHSEQKENQPKLVEKKINLSA
jgi:hypothetical protein